MKYEIGQKVTTPLGDGEVIALGSAFNGVESYRVRFTLPKDENGYLHPIVEFPHYHLKPYKTPHERLLEMGFVSIDTSRYINGKDFRQYVHNKLELDLYFQVKKKTYYLTRYEEATEVSLELSRILTDYLEWLEEEK